MSTTQTHANDARDEQLRAANAADLKAWSKFLDLPVMLTIELGRTTVTARQLLELKNDSIVQLPRSTGEGVDIVAGEYRIASGEIILIEDRSGVRISELIGNAKA